MNLLVISALVCSSATYAAAERELKSGQAQIVAQDIFDKAIAQQLLRMGKPDVNRIMRHITSRIERLRIVRAEDHLDLYMAIKKLVSRVEAMRTQEQDDAKKEILARLQDCINKITEKEEEAEELEIGELEEKS